MPDCPKETITALKRIEAPELLINLANGVSAPGKLRWHFQEPKEFYFLIREHPGNMPFEDQLIPLWELNGDCVTAYVDQQPPFIIQYYYEDPQDKYETIGTNVLEAIEHRLEWLLVECDTDPERIFDAAKAFDHPDPLGFVRRVNKNRE